MTQPKTFYFIVDKDGEPVDIMCRQMDRDYMFKLAEGYNIEEPTYAPFEVWECHGGNIKKVQRDLFYVKNRTVEVCKR